MALHLTDLPHFASLADLRTVKVVRHKDGGRHNLRELILEDRFQAYQNRQSSEVFAKATHLLSFISDRHQAATFVGVWTVEGVRPSRHGVIYRTAEQPGFEDLSLRLMVDWGGGTRSWVQWLHRAGDKPIREIKPPHFVRDYPGYYDIQLPWAELQQILSHPDAHREWQHALRSATGVYAILDQRSRKLYIGSAYGAAGIWGRWSSYCKTGGHGGNKLLKALLAKQPRRVRHFTFSILRVMESGCSKDAVIAQEQLLKQKLGGRVCSLNAN